MSTYSWKHHFYAFLLRRALGPILTTQSAADLRTSIQDVDWSEGKIVLVDVGLDAEYLTGLVHKSISDDTGETKSNPLSNVAIQKARIRRLGIHLSLCENNSTDCELVSTSTARNATSALLRNIFGSFDENSASIALVVHVELDGVEIEIAPNSKHVSEPSHKRQSNLNTPTLDTDRDEAAPGFVTSLVDSAIKSLRLSVNISGLNVRLTSQDKWITLKLASARYYDSINSKNNSHSGKNNAVATEAEEIVLSKAIDWNEFSIETCQLGAGVHSLVKMTGDGHVNFRFYEKKDTDVYGIHGRREIDVSLGRHVAVELDSCILTRLMAISDSFSSTSSQENPVIETDESDFADVPEYTTQTCALADEFTREAYDEVMKQYTEARHMARTRELRGGVLIPSLNDGEAGEISFDAFFDANDHSVSYYCDLVEDSWTTGNTALHGKKHVHEMSTRIDFGVSQFTLKLLGESDGPTAVTSSSEYILVSMGDLQLIMFESAGEKKINSSISHFDIESQVEVGNSVLNETMLRFVDQPEEEDSDELLVSSPPCISAYAELSRVANGENTCRLDLVVQPIEIICMRKAISCLNSLAAVAASKQQISKEVGPGAKFDIHMSLSCGSLVVLVPCPNTVESDSLFARCGYEDVDERLTPFLCLGVEIGNISADISNRTSEDSKAIAKFSQAVLFAKCTKVESSGRCRRRFASSYVTRRVDLMTCSSDEEQASDSFIVASYAQLHHNKNQQTCRKKSNFPMILPLSSMKACQEVDSDVEDLFDDMIQSPGSQNGHVAANKATDPQYIMSSEANEANSELSLCIPCVWFDITLAEKQDLVGILTEICGQTNQREAKTSNGCFSNSSPRRNKRKWIGFSISVGQLSSVLYGDKPTMSSYSFVFDQMQVHTLIDGASGVRNIRFSSADCTLYEMSDLTSQHGNSCPASGAARCKRVHERMILNKCFSQAQAIFFRSKLSQPLSQEYPALLVDVLLRKSESPEDQFDEKIVHLGVYDMTYRYFVGSEWLENLTSLVKIGTSEEESFETSDEDVDSLMNLFVNVTDCNLDYTSPVSYRTASRSILRIGDIHLSSNLLSTRGGSSVPQAFKVSLSEIGLFVCNYRRSYNEENVLLSSSHRHFNGEHISLHGTDRRLTKRSMANIVSALSCMDFINVLAIDSIDAAILVNSSNGCNHFDSEPRKTIVLTIGTVNCNFCKDSFSCLTDTFNEWFIRFTAVSEEELENLRLISEQSAKRKTADRISNRAYNDASSSSTEKEIDSDVSVRNIEEAASVDLSETLLFQDYYTLDAKNKSHSAGESSVMQQHVNVINESPSSDDDDDDWAAVEHEYLRNSRIPQEDEQHAEWIMYDDEDDDIQRQTKAIKIFPQHFQSKPVSGSLGEGYADPMPAGAEVNPQIDARLIIKDASITCHFFDGLDWEPMQSPVKPRIHPNDRKKVLLSNLLNDEGQNSNTLGPLPGERSELLKRDNTKKRLRRNVQRYFSVTINGLALNQDSYVNSTQHQLASSLNLSAADFFVAETISSKDPVKMIGEWVNEDEHPRDNNDGVIMLSMVTNHPTLRVSADGKLMSDESQATLELLPLRAFFHQTAIRFARGFFAGEAVESKNVGNVGESNDREEDLEIIPVFFTSFKVRPAKLKVDYTPEKMDVESFREGNYVEILNLCPLEDMVLTLQAVENHDLTGWGSVFGELAGRWIEDVGKTQSHKFFTRATPVQFFSGVTEGAADLAMVLVVVPESGSFADYLKEVLYSRYELLIAGRSFVILVTQRASILSSHLKHFICE